MVVEHEVGFGSEFEPGSPEAIAMAKVEPILRRPVTYHTTVAGDFDQLKLTIGDILRDGLLPGAATGRSEHAIVFKETSRQREIFRPQNGSRPDWAVSTLIERLEEGRSIDDISKIPVISSTNGLTISILVDRPMVLFGNFGEEPLVNSEPYILPEDLKGIVIIGSIGSKIVLSSALLAQIRKNAIGEVDSYLNNPKKLLNGLIDNDYYLDTFFEARVYELMTGGWLLERPLNVEQIEDVISEFNFGRLKHEAVGLSRRKGFIEDVYDLITYANQIGRNINAYRSDKYEFAPEPEKTGPKEVDRGDLRSLFEVVFIVALAKLYRQRRSLSELLKKDQRDVVLKSGFEEVEVSQVIDLVRATRPMPIYYENGALIWPKKMSFDEILEGWLRKQGVRL